MSILNNFTNRINSGSSIDRSDNSFELKTGGRFRTRTHIETHRLSRETDRNRNTDNLTDRQNTHTPYAVEQLIQPPILSPVPPTHPPAHTSPRPAPSITSSPYSPQLKSALKPSPPTRSPHAPCDPYSDPHSALQLRSKHVHRTLKPSPMSELVSETSTPQSAYRRKQYDRQALKAHTQAQRGTTHPNSRQKQEIRTTVTTEGRALSPKFRSLGDQSGQHFLPYCISYAPHSHIIKCTSKCTHVLT